MPPHYRILQYPFAEHIQNARLLRYRADQRRRRLDITLEILALQRRHSELFLRDGEIVERLSGQWLPTQVQFQRVSGLDGGDYFAALNLLPPEDERRLLFDLLAVRRSGQAKGFHVLSVKTPDAPDLLFHAAGMTYSQSPEQATPAELERNWCLAPPLPGGLIPKPAALHRRFGGDPLPVNLDGRLCTRRLFVGGLDVQPETRPQVDFVLNLGEDPSMWPEPAPQDRWEPKGEGRYGMSLDELCREADWVVERLQAGKRVLVHCAAGMNRSASVCCAAIMRLEGLSAEAALARIRQTHPWARPDGRYWLKLRWLGEGQG